MKQQVCEYYNRVSVVLPWPFALAAKWHPEDRLPGLSDLDFRLVIPPGTGGLATWDRVSHALCDVHRALTASDRRWHRALEHLPGVILTIDEFEESISYDPESRHWCFHHGDVGLLSRAVNYLCNRPWSPQDERYHLKRLAHYSRVDNPHADPPINVVRGSCAYRRHSLHMHYFAPAVQSAVSVVLGRTVVGKQEALREATRLFPDPEVVEASLRAIHSQYFIGSESQCAATEVDSRMAGYVLGLWARVRPHVLWHDLRDCVSPELLRMRMGQVAVPAHEEFFDGVRYARLMKGRLRFYGSAPLMFAAEPILRDLLPRLAMNLCRRPLEAYGRYVYGSLVPWEVVLNRLPPIHCSAATRADILRLSGLCTAQVPSGKERSRALECADAWDALLSTLETIGEDLRGRLARDEGKH